MEDIYQLLSQHNFTLVNETIDHYKCIICQRMLINACQAVCGCNYCKNCVVERVRGGAIYCPGLTEKCKMAKLSNIAINDEKNRQISQLVVKCTEESCCYKSQLKTIGEHLRLCGKTSVECPFTDVGCDRGKLAIYRLNEHLQQGGYHHIEILIGVIGKLRNELAALKLDREKYDKTVDELMKNDREKGAMIETMRREMESMRRQINSIKMEKKALEQRMDNLASTTAMEVGARLEEMRRECREIIEHQQQLATQSRAEMTERIDAMEKCLAEKIDADFAWTIDNIAEKQRKKEIVCSENFNGCANPYKMYLRCYNDIDELWIRLFIIDGDSDESLRWPFESNVTIAITNQMRPNARKSITNHCIIAQPIMSRWSDPFSFKWTELSNGGLLQGDRLTVQCFIRDA